SRLSRLLEDERLATVHGTPEHGNTLDVREYASQQLKTFAANYTRQRAHASDIAARPAQPGHDPLPDWIVDVIEDDGNRLGCPSSSDRRWCRERDNHIHGQIDQLGRERRKPLNLAVCE